MIREPPVHSEGGPASDVGFVMAIAVLVRVEVGNFRMARGNYGTMGEKMRIVGGDIVGLVKGKD